LTQSQIDPPVTANRSERRSTRKRRFPVVLVLVPIVLVAAGVGLILLLSGGSSGGVLGGIIGGEEPVVVPQFEFRLGRTGAVATVAEADQDALKAQAETVTQDVVPLLDDLYTNAFLDPANWREGDYEEVLALFSDESAAAAAQSVETLTLGATAGDVYDTVTPNKGSLSFSVLFDQEGNPHTVVATVKFYALGARQDGTYTSIVSVGEMFLRDLDGWKITAFEVRRGDHETEPPPSPTPSGSASASGSGGS
jgi:hypothetical protein